MFLVSNSDMEYIKRYIALFCANTDASPMSNLRAINNVRMAKNLLKKLERKQPLEPGETPGNKKTSIDNA